MENGQAGIRVLLGAQHALFRQAVTSFLKTCPGVELVADAEDGWQVVEQSDRTKPDVVLLDADMPLCDGIRAARMLKERLPPCSVLILSDVEDLETLCAALLAGARGYLTKASALEEVAGAIRSVHGGETVIPSQMLEPLLSLLISGRGLGSRRWDDRVQSDDPRLIGGRA